MALPYIHHIRVVNYKSIGEIELTLSPVTIFVGANGTGKSNILDAFNFVRDALNLGLEQAVLKRGGPAAIRRWSSKGRPYDISFEFEIRKNVQTTPTEGDNATPDEGDNTTPDRVIYSLDLGGKRKTELRVKSEKLVGFSGSHKKIEIRRSRNELKAKSDNYHASRKLENIDFPINENELFLFRGYSLLFAFLADDKEDDRGMGALIRGITVGSSLLEILKEMSFYNIYPNVIKVPQKPGHEKYLDDDASNFASVLRRLLTQKNNWKSMIVDYLNAASPRISDIQVHQVGQFLVTKIYRQLTERTKAAFDLSQESDGTLRLLALLTALLQIPSRSLIGVEEPEIYIHPGALSILKDAIYRSQVHSQIIITTHSPQMLDLFEPDIYRIVEKKEGLTTVSNIPHFQIETIKDGLLNASEVFVSHSFSPNEA